MTHAPMPGGYETVLSQGKEWKLTWVTPGIRKAFSQWAIARAKERFTGDKESLDWLRSQIAAGRYDWGNPYDDNGIGDQLSESMNTGEGGIKLFMLLLQPSGEDLQIEEIEALFMSNVEGFKEAVERCILPNQRTPLNQGGYSIPGMTSEQVTEAIRQVSQTPTSSP